MYALILAGGKGERLKPLTDSRPKPMVEVLGKPILWHQVQWLRRCGVANFVLLVGYKWQAVQEFFGDGASLGVKIRYSVEDSPLGRGGAVRKGLSLVPVSEKSVIVTNGDVLTDLEISPMVEQHRASGHLVTTMAVQPMSPFGVMEFDATGRVSCFSEKPTLPLWINGGVYVFDRAMETLLPERGDHEDTAFPRLAAEGKLGAYPSKAFWRSVDTFKDLREAETALRALAG